MAFFDLFARNRALNARPAYVWNPLRALDVWRSRRALARLDARALEDIGITLGQAREETKKPVWDVPDNWLS